VVNVVRKTKPARELSWEPTTFRAAPPGLFAYYYEHGELVKMPEGWQEEQHAIDERLGIYGRISYDEVLRDAPRGFLRSPDRACERPVVGYCMSNEDGQLHAVTVDEQARVKPVVSFPGFERIGFRRSAVSSASGSREA
jgi:Uma2 family endonuclease